MRTYPLFFVAFLTVLASGTLGCPGPSNGSVEDAGVAALKEGVWVDSFDAQDWGSASGVWGTSPNDVFVVGGTEVGKVRHFDGTSWIDMSVPETGLLIWAYGFGPENVYVVGMGGAAIHFDGTTWTKLETGTTLPIWGVFGHADDDLWMVGGDAFEGDPILLHFDGSTFSAVTLDATQNAKGAHALFKVWGIGSKLFTVGQFGTILEFRDSEWHFVDAGANADDDFISLWGTSESQIIAVGGRANGRIALYDGTTWTTLAPDGAPGFNAVFATSSEDIYMGGVWGTVGRFDLASQTFSPDERPTFYDVHALWSDGAARVFGVGGTFVTPHHGVVIMSAAP